MNAGLFVRALHRWLVAQTVDGLAAQDVRLKDLLEIGGLNEEIHIAVMGCEVNGPGEARVADIGVAGGKGIGLIFKRGEVIRKVPETEIRSAMREEVDKFLAERKAETKHAS